MLKMQIMDNSSGRFFCWTSPYPQVKLPTDLDKLLRKLRGEKSWKGSILHIAEERRILDWAWIEEEGIGAIRKKHSSSDCTQEENEFIGIFLDLIHNPGSGRFK